MDQLLLQSFNNLSVALQNLADALEKNNEKEGPRESMVTDAISKLGITEQLKMIDQGVRQVIEGNTEIIASQKNILSAMQKPVEKKEEGEKATIQKRLLTMVQKIFKKQEEDSSKIDSTKKAAEKKDSNAVMIDKNKQGAVKDGIKLIVMIAAAVLLIGLAFRVISGVDFKSIIALSLAIPLLAITMEKISQVKITDYKSFGISLVALGLLSVAMVGVSYLLSRMANVTDEQGKTAILIAATFAILSISLEKIANGIEKVSLRGLLKMPVVLMAASLAIMGSSYLLSFVKPLSLSQGATIIMIGATFALLSFSLAKLANNIEKASLKGLLAMPIALIAASYAISKSSEFLASVVPMSSSQFFTSIGIALVFVPLAFSLVLISKAFEKLSIAKMVAASVALPILMVAMSAAIMASSLILVQTQVVDPSLLFNIFLQALTLAGTAIVMGLTIFVLDKLGLASAAGLGKAFAGGLVIVTIAGAIALSSVLLAMGDYTKAPTLEWTLNAGVSILAFGLLIGVTGALIALSGFGIGAAAILAGALTVIAIAGTIYATDSILSKGSYKVAPKIDWLMSVGLSIVGFGIIMALSGALIIATFGTGAAALLAGAAAVLGIAKVIVETDKILSQGKFKNYPTLDWALGVGASITAFGLIMAASGAALVATLGLGALAGKVGTKAVLKIAQTIVDVDKILSSGNYQKYPTPTWLKSVGEILGTMSITLAAASLLLPSVLAGSATLLAIAGTIYVVDKLLSSGNYTKYPTMEYITGINSSIRSFSSLISEFAPFIFDTVIGSKAVIAIAKSIKITSLEIAAGNYSKTISMEYNESILNAFKYHSRILKSVGLLDPLLSEIAVSNANGIARVSLEISKGSYSTKIPKDWAENVSELFKGYKKITEVVESMNPGFFSSAMTAVTSGLKDFFGFEKAGPKMTPESVATNIVALSKIVSMGSFKPIPKDWMASVYENMKSYFKILDLLDGQGMSTEILGVSISIGRGISRMASDYEKLATGIQKVSAAINSIDIDKVTGLRALTGSVVLLSLMDADQFEDVMDALEEKSEILGNILDKASEAGQSGLPSVRQPVAITNEGPGMNDVIGLIRQIDLKLGAIASSNSNISSYVNEIRSSPTKVGLRK